mmetsp:Transcript_61684/g.198728  ORF Transcript_61684/g.198728 Transcript_61684/m.198728 type:complete len:1023 (+) Transcript_61684:81-3149(+)
MATAFGLASQALRWLGKAWTAHQRSNHLHCEVLAQALRIHEAETLAEQEYHRVCVRAANDQHAREVLQARYQHEEDIDNERRVATRDNIRDDWQKLSDRAETVLIVNTLLLAVAFAMLIEGQLPESAPWATPVVTVVYFSTLSSSLCLLISSIRFAVVLRFRVGCTIVEEMREAIAQTTQLDDCFRAHRAYLRCNRPEVTLPACEGRSQPCTACHLTHPLTWQMRPSRQPRDGLASATSEAGTPMGFVDPPPGPGYEDLSWVCSGDTGFTARHARLAAVGGLLGTLRGDGRNVATAPAGSDSRAPLSSTASRARESLAVGGNVREMPGGAARGLSDPAACRLPEVQPPAAPAAVAKGPSVDRASRDLSMDSPLDVQIPSKHVGIGSSAVDESSDTSSNGNLNADDPVVAVALHHLPSARFTAHGPCTCSSRISESVCNAAFTGEEALESQYQSLVQARLGQNDHIHTQLKRLQTLRCQPWETSSQRLLASGTLLLLMAACLLVFGRYYAEALPVGENARAPAAASLVAWGFASPCIMTVLMLAYLEALLHRVRRRHRSARVTRQRRRSIRREMVRHPSFEPGTVTSVVGSLSAWGSSGPSRGEPGATGAASCAQSSHGNSNTLSTCDIQAVPGPSPPAFGAASDEQADRDAPAIACSLSVAVIGSLLLFVLIAAQGVTPLSVRGSGEASERRSTLPSILNIATLGLAHGTRWPAFWSPVAGAWLQQQQVLVLTDGRDAIEAAIEVNTTGSDAASHCDLIRPLRLRRLTGHVMDLGGVCIVQGAESAIPLFFAVDKALRLRALSVGSDIGSGDGPRQDRSSSSLRAALYMEALQPRVGCHSASVAPVREQGGLELWLASGQEAWPTLSGARLLHGSCNGASSSLRKASMSRAPACQLNVTRRWPTEWLLYDQGVRAALGDVHGVSVDGITILHQGRLLLLLSCWVSAAYHTAVQASAAMQAREPSAQLLVILSSQGLLQRWWPLSSRGAHGKWRALAADEAKGRLFLVSSGPELQVAMLPLAL